MWFLFLKSAAAGLALAAPVGPMAVLCIRRTMSIGWRAGLATGAGIASGDALLSAIAALGLVGVSHFVLLHERALHLIAGPILIYLGLRTFLHRAGPSGVEGDADSLRGSYASSALLTLANPPTLITFAALFAAIAPPGAPRFSAVLATVSGVAAGSLLWWVVLTCSIAAFRNAITPGLRTAISVLSGVALTGFGIVQELV